MAKQEKRFILITGFNMKKRTSIFLLLIAVCSGTVVFAQQKSKPTVIIKKEFYPPSEQEDENEDSEGDLVFGHNAHNDAGMKKCLPTLSYNSVVSKLNNTYTITKWKYQNIHDEKIVDTMIVIKNASYDDRLVFYKQKGKNKVPLLISATIGSKRLSAGTIKVGMAQLMVDRALEGKVDMNEDQTEYYMSNSTGNSYFTFTFENGLLKYIGYVGYWD
jgi:hypothetical protein